ncbi:hypothetical protein [Aeromonas sp. 600282]|uniref:hypothetical protein n=1 Tax=Aeromonas sp. 600282 TaxID=2712027 RepID=UPI003B9F6A13
MGEWRDKNLQATENKGLIKNKNVLNATPDEGDDGVGSVIDTTKVTSSTPADQGVSPCLSAQTDKQQPINE